MNSFTDAQPVFPYRSSEASEKLGLPETPEVHLAVTEVADQLLQVAALSGAEPEILRIAALRTASGAVLFGWSLVSAERELRRQLKMPDIDGPPPEPWIHQGKDWLGEAVVRLRGEGISVRKDYQRQRSNYGWVPL